MTATAIKNWSSTAASNNSASPNGAPEGMPPSGVNNTIRQNMTAVRDWYIDPAWIDYGYTYTYVATTQFKISGLNKTSDFVVGYRVRAVGTSTGTIYGVITASAFSTDTTVTVSWDSGTLANETLAISAGMPSSGFPYPFLDSSFSIWDNVDPTKKIAFQLSSITTGNTRTITIPDADLTMVGTTTTQTLSNKSLSTIVAVRTNLTIASGSVTITGSNHTIDTESSAASDDLDTMTAGTDGQFLRIRAASSARTIVVKNLTGNIICGADISLDNSADAATFIYDSALSQWVLLSFSNNGA